MEGEIKERMGWTIYEWVEEVDKPVPENNEIEILLPLLEDKRKRTLLREKIAYLKEGQGIELEVSVFRLLLVKKLGKVYIAVHPRMDSHSEFMKKGSGMLTDDNFISHSEKMNQMMDIIRKVSYVDSVVLLLGKSGVGKSAVAKIIHKYSTRSEKTFVCVNCGAIPESLIEAELFGYSHGSFTGGQKGGKAGIFESANGGTVFLDEIGELPFHLQAKLLEVLQDNRIRPVGSVQSIPVDVRVIAATNQDLEAMVAQKKFREDLYYRLNVVPIKIPSLSERKEDIHGLMYHFLHVYSAKYGVVKTFAPEVETIFLEYGWPGNVRELKNIIERLFITTEENEITIHHLPEHLLSDKKELFSRSRTPSFIPLKEARKNLEQEIIMEAYNIYKNTYKVAEILQVTQSTIAKKVKQYRDRGE